MVETFSPSGLMIHIGYHKTGTTWLQDAVFNNARYGMASPWSRQTITDDFIIPPPFSFDRNDVLLRYQKKCDELRNQGLLPVLSHERMSGYPASGGFDSKTIADRLYSIFPEGRVIIIIREQKSIIRSWYTQYIRDGGGLSIKKYMNPPEPDLLRVPHFNYDFYQYDRLIDYYRTLFSRERVLVLPFELLKANHLDFMKRITKFANLPDIADVPGNTRNEGIGLPWVTITRTANRLFHRNQLNSGALFNAPIVIKNARRAAYFINRTLILRGMHNFLERNTRRYIAENLGDRYAESNTKTSKAIGIDLQEFGYDCR